MATTTLNKHAKCMSISSKYVSTSSIHKSNSVGEWRHSCLTPMSHITSLYVMPCIWICVFTPLAYTMYILERLSIYPSTSLYIHSKLHNWLFMFQFNWWSWISYKVWWTLDALIMCAIITMPFATQSTFVIFIYRYIIKCL